MTATVTDPADKIRLSSGTVQIYFFPHESRQDYEMIYYNQNVATIPKGKLEILARMPVLSLPYEFKRIASFTQGVDPNLFTLEDYSSFHNTFAQARISELENQIADQKIEEK